MEAGNQVTPKEDFDKLKSFFTEFPELIVNNKDGVDSIYYINGNYENLDESGIGLPNLSLTIEKEDFLDNEHLTDVMDRIYQNNQGAQFIRPNQISVVDSYFEGTLSKEDVIDNFRTGMKSKRKVPTKLDFRVKGNSVSHYGNTIQPIELITKLGLDFNMGNCIKYIYRHKDKGQASALNKTLDYFYWRLTQWDNHSTPSVNQILSENNNHFRLYEKFHSQMKESGMEWESKFISWLVLNESSYFDALRNTKYEDSLKGKFEFIYNKINIRSYELYGEELKSNLVYEYMIENNYTILEVDGE